MLDAALKLDQSKQIAALVVLIVVGVLTCIFASGPSGNAARACPSPRAAAARVAPSRL